MIAKIWNGVVVCPYTIILITTVNIFLVVMTNGTICCLNCFIIRYTKTCPNVVRQDSMSMSYPNLGYFWTK